MNWPYGRNCISRQSTRIHGSDLNFTLIRMFGEELRGLRQIPSEYVPGLTAQSPKSKVSNHLGAVDLLTLISERCFVGAHKNSIAEIGFSRLR